MPAPAYYVPMGTPYSEVQTVHWNSPKHRDAQTGDSHMIFSDFRIFYQTVYPNDPNSPLTKDIDQIEKLNLKYMQIHFPSEYPLSITIIRRTYYIPGSWKDSTMAGLLPVTKELSDLLMLLPAPIHCVYVLFPKRIINTCCRSGY